MTSVPRVSALEARTLQTATFTLSLFPVPLSACFDNVARNGRKDSDRYKAWKMGVDAALARCSHKYLGAPGRPHFNCEVAVEYAVRRPDRRARDLDNLCKSLGDTLVRNFIVRDDADIVDLRIRWADDLTSVAPVRVTISEAA